MGRNTVCYCSVFFGTNLLRQPSKRVNAPCKLRQWRQAGFWEPCRVFVFVCVCFLPLFPPTRQFKSSFSPLLCVIWLYSNPGTINPPVSFHYSCMGAPSRPPLPPAPPLFSSPLPHLLLPSFYCFSGIEATEEAHHITSATTILRLMGPIVVTGSYAAFRTSDD